jgi:hypothetical protein
MAQALRLPEIPLPRCGVCGCDRIRTDVVDPGADRAPLLLAECPRCDHRWTGTLRERGPAVAGRPALRVLREGASAA